MQNVSFNVVIRVFEALALTVLLAACSSATPSASPTSAPVATVAPTTPPATIAPAPTTAPTTAPTATLPPAATAAPAAERILPAPLYLINEQQQIVRLERDGTTMATITNEATPIVQLAAAPIDGTLLYIMQGDQSNTLVQTDARGGQRTELAAGILSIPVWSRDGQRYALAWEDGPQGAGIYGARAGEKPGLLLANIPFKAGNSTPGLRYTPQAFSPDGSRLLLATAPDNGPDAPAGDIAVLGAAVLASDGTATTLVGTGGDPYLCFSALWSTDGSQVICSSYGASGAMPALWSLPASGGKPTILLPPSSGQTDVFSVMPTSTGLYAFVGTAKTVGENVTYVLEQIDANGKASKLRDETFDINAVVWSVWAPDASGIVIQRASTDGSTSNQFVWLPASDAPAVELRLRGQGTPVWGAPGT